MPIVQINTTNLQGSETNVNWVEDGEFADDIVLNRAVKDVAVIVNEVIVTVNDIEAGLFDLVDSVTSTSISTAATSKSAKLAYDKGVEALNSANNAQNKASDSDKLDGINSTQFLRSDISDIMSGDLTVSGDIRAGSAGEIAVGVGSGSVAMTINDGQGNSNLTFNHRDGVPDQDGNAARMVVNTDSTTNASIIFELKSNVSSDVSADTSQIMEINESGVNVVGDLTATNFIGSANDSKLLDGLDSTQYLRSDIENASGLFENITLDDKIASTGDTHTYLQFHGEDRYRVVTGGNERFEVTNNTTTVSNDLVVAGDLTVNGETTQINTTVTTLDDPIITLADNTSSDDNKDRGVEFKWHDGSGVKTGFFGYNDSASRFSFIKDGTNSSEVFAGTLGDAEFSTVYADLSGNATSATKLNTARTISLSGDASGSVSFDGTSNANITVAVANDSHTHDGRYFTETESDARFANITGDTFTGQVIMDAGTNTSLVLRRDIDQADSPAQLLITGDSDITDDLALEIRGNAAGNTVDTSQTLTSPDTTFAVFNNGVTAIGYNNLGADYTSPQSSKFAVNGIGYFANDLYSNGANKVFNDSYHPNADKLTTSRTISLSGDASGSVSFDGSGNANIPVTVSVVNQDWVLKWSGNTISVDNSWGDGQYMVSIEADNGAYTVDVFVNVYDYSGAQLAGTSYMLPDRGTYTVFYTSSTFRGQRQYDFDKGYNEQISAIYKLEDV
jgi:hypothetical protein